jgi:hypothetical protein
VLRASGADADGLENKDGKDNDEDSEIGDAGGVLRASGADADGLENKDRRNGDDDSENGDAGGVPPPAQVFFLLVCRCPSNLAKQPFGKRFLTVKVEWAAFESARCQRAYVPGD